MMPIRVLYAICVVAWTPVVSSLSIKGETKKSCAVLTDKGTVDLTPVAKTDGTSAAFTAQGGPGISSTTTAWNPCVDTTIPAKGCTLSGEIFQVFTTPIGCGTLSTKSDAKFSVKDDKLQLDYASDELTSHITLSCVSTATATPFARDPSCYDPAADCFTLSHPVCCLKPVKPGSGSGGLSGGSILLIIVLVLAVLYVVGGILFMKFVKKAEGVELCPNISFWKSLPFFVKDGFMFVIRCGKASNSSKYDDL